ncbi:MAG TPA: NERD domain-containing protein, partial [Blastocatellia bacterium]|nr:NERD domain-containing protein [Blastocatellia bacterium]
REPEQARRNAADLSRELTSATGEPVKVKPILTLPGWYITPRGKSDVTIVNPKEIRQVILSNDPPRLSPEQIQRIAHQLEQKCRDVGF